MEADPCLPEGTIKLHRLKLEEALHFGRSPKGLKPGQHFICSTSPGSSRLMGKTPRDQAHTSPLALLLLSCTGDLCLHPVKPISGLPTLPGLSPQTSGGCFGTTGLSCLANRLVL